MKCEGRGPEAVVRAVACVYANDTFFPNASSWTVGNIVRKCALGVGGGPGSVVQRTGCVDDFGEVVGLGGEFRTKDGLHMRRCLGPNGRDDWRTAIVACLDVDALRRPCDQARATFMGHGMDERRMKGVIAGL